MSAIGKLVPLAILFAVVGVFVWVGYQMYVFANDLADRGTKKMEKKNITFTKDGMKVGVKEVRTEDYEDRTQSVFVKTWNYANDGKDAKKSGSKPSASRTNSGLKNKSG
ncbi:hypothetical protein P152DRAFT_175308 [Eremomyces bilateralis CBS 781.70]|uniref:Uncharacterized protein n=1 Tax=Eremomyces bilateralis CBS 781.70 TaxID=1392243 RepID=A0A6G1FTK5_9PEZI|nr:uncharacterized protein P152DRAFT_175308 [Eremomyces bilateralis CBS 781.70]KAF1809070.1 hypothetical protein P152DRAFT_175308 [Eremomyces bilateralis CBS 781.70]